MQTANRVETLQSACIGSTQNFDEIIRDLNALRTEIGNARTVLQQSSIRSSQLQDLELILDATACMLNEIEGILAQERSFLTTQSSTGSSSGHIMQSAAEALRFEVVRLGWLNTVM